MGRVIPSTWAGHASMYSAARWSGGRRAGKTSRPLPSPRRRVSVRERYSGRRRQRLAGTSPAARTTRGGVPAGEAPDRRAALERGRSMADGGVRAARMHQRCRGADGLRAPPPALAMPRPRGAGEETARQAGGAPEPPYLSLPCGGGAGLAGDYVPCCCAGPRTSALKFAGG